MAAAAAARRRAEKKSAKNAGQQLESEFGTNELEFVQGITCAKP